MIELLLCDDHPVVRAGLRALFLGEDDMTVVGEASTPEDAVALAERLEPDLVLMDLQFRTSTNMNGVDGTRHLRQLPMPPAVLVLTNYDTDSDILATVEAGAGGYLLKDAPPEHLLTAVRKAAAGASALAPEIVQRLSARHNHRGQHLSQREIKVLNRVAHGMTNAQISDDLHLSEATVKSHLVHVYTKLDVTSRTAAVAAAREQGLIRAL